MALRPTAYKDAEVASLQRAGQENAARVGIKPYTRSKAIPVLLISGTVLIQHGLKRKPSGWLLHSVLGSSTAYIASAPDSAAIAVTAGSAGSCVLEVW